MRRTFSDIRKWGTIQDYKAASRYLQKQVFDKFVDDKITNMPSTQAELFEGVKQELQKSYADLVDENDAWTEQRDHDFNVYSAEPEGPAKEAMAADIQDTDNTIIQNNQKLNMLETFNRDDKVLKDMWKDLYPNCSFRRQGIVSTSEDDPKRDDPESLERDQSEKITMSIACVQTLSRTRTRKARRQRSARM